MTPAEAARLARAALGTQPADLVIQNCRVLNTYTGRIIGPCQVGVAGEHIAYLVPEARAVGPTTTVIDGEGMILIPGLIDAHNHLDEVLVTPDHYLRATAARGTTTLITGTSAVANALGYEGVRRFLDLLKGHPSRVYNLVPTGSENPAIKRSLTLQEVSELMGLPEVVGLGEVSWRRLAAGEKELYEMIALAIRANKTVEGHGAGARGEKLAALAACTHSCHEAITVNEVKERLELGLFTILREGSIRRDLEALAPIAREKLDFRWLGLGTDCIYPSDLLSRGAMEYVVKKAVDLGFSPVTAIQMATINNATHFGLHRLLGAIAPGRYADMVLTPNLEEITAEYVVKGGRMVAARGRPLADFEATALSGLGAGKEALDFSRRFSPEELQLKTAVQGKVSFRAIRQINEMITGEEIIELEGEEGVLRPQGGHDVCLAVAVSSIDPKSYATGYVTGWNLSGGACATSAAWDAPHIVGVGVTARELALAINRVAELGGGWAVARGDNVITEMPLPIAGIMADRPVDEVARAYEAFNDLLHQLGCPFTDPLLALRALVFVKLPHLRLSALGLVDVRKGVVVPGLVS